jgi:4-carboxymuconolactone decarboxylase
VTGSAARPGRLAEPPSESLTAAQARLLQVSSPDNRWAGPYTALARVPDAGLALHSLVRSIDERTLAPALRETAILTTAAGLGCAYGWHAHVPLGLAAGLDRDGLERLGAGLDPRFEDARVQRAWRATGELLAMNPGTSTETAALIEEDEVGGVALIVLVGAYRSIFQLVAITGGHRPPSSVPLCTREESGEPRCLM